MSFRDYLDEAISKDKAQELYGKILFGDLLEKGERDTKIEERIYKLMQEFVLGKGMDRYFLKFLKELRDAKVHFPDVLKPDAKIVYRGSRIDKHILENLTDGKTFKGEYQKFNYIYEPRGKIQSFTTKFSVAISEFFQEYEADETPIVYEVKTDDDFLFSSKIMNMLNQIVRLDPEYEILRISQKPLKCNIIIHESKMN